MGVFATVVATVTGSEVRVLVESIRQAEHKIDVRCVLLDDPALLAALLNAHYRGVRVRIAVDTLTPLLRKAGKGLDIRVMRREFRGQFLVPSDNTGREDYLGKGQVTPKIRRYLQEGAPEATVAVDRIWSWQGVSRLSPQSWVGLSVVCIYSRYPDPAEGCERFVSAWKRSEKPEPRAVFL